MNKNTIYFKQVQLVVRVLPLIAFENCFALKGGTAINLFVRDLPRLSVDIDLVYIPLHDREEALKNIREALIR
jgi:predicted nucleotidyltransferase component of viral defense system